MRHTIFINAGEPPLFTSGETVASAGVMEMVGDDAGKHAELAKSFARHFTGDWGDMEPEDQAENTRHLNEHRRLMSAYTIGDVKIWIITEADRSVTTALLPEEY